MTHLNNLNNGNRPQGSLYTACIGLLWLNNKVAQSPILKKVQSVCVFKKILKNLKRTIYVSSCNFQRSFKVIPGNTKRGNIIALLTSCLTGLESALWQLTIFVFICKTGLSKQEVNGTVILSPLVFPGWTFFEFHNRIAYSGKPKAAVWPWPWQQNCLSEW